MTVVFSKIDRDLILHQYCLLSEVIPSERLNISDASESLQASLLHLSEGKTFKPHKHIEHLRSMPMAQESWVVIKGLVEVHYYDIDDTIVEKIVLSPGDLTITYRGGHNYLSLSEDTIVYEFKTGPYMGQAYDKVLI